MICLNVKIMVEIDQTGEPSYASMWDLFNISPFNT